MSLHVLHSEADDAVRLAPYLRQADRDEIAAASGASPLEALRQGYDLSAEPMTIVTDDGFPCAMFGIVPLGDGRGAPWLLGSGRIEEHWFTFVRRSRDELARLRAGWGVLTNAVDERNTLHVRWLQWLGFEMVERIENYGVGRLPFWRFECATR